MSAVTERCDRLENCQKLQKTRIPPDSRTMCRIIDVDAKNTRHSTDALFYQPGTRCAGDSFEHERNLSNLEPGLMRYCAFYLGQTVNRQFTNRPRHGVSRRRQCASMSIIRV